jgi:hypothetical protein
MAEKSYFLKPESWTVIDGTGALTQFLPAKGSLRIVETQNGAKTTFRIVPVGRSRFKAREGFTFLQGRLEQTIKGTDGVLIIDQGESSDGKDRLMARVERRPKRGVKKLSAQDVSGTWGAETNPGGGAKN